MYMSRSWACVWLHCAGVGQGLRWRCSPASSLKKPETTRQICRSHFGKGASGTFNTDTPPPIPKPQSGGTPRQYTNKCAKSEVPCGNAALLTIFALHGHVQFPVEMPSSSSVAHSWCLVPDCWWWSWCPFPLLAHSLPAALVLRGISFGWADSSVRHHEEAGLKPPPYRPRTGFPSEVLLPSPFPDLVHRSTVPHETWIILGSATRRFFESYMFG